MLHTRNNTDGNKLVIFSGIASYYGDNYILYSTVHRMKYLESDIILCNTVPTVTVEEVMTFSGCNFFDHQCNHGDRKVEESNDVTMVLSVACVKGGQTSNSHC